VGPGTRLLIEGTASASGGLPQPQFDLRHQDRSILSGCAPEADLTMRATGGGATRHALEGSKRRASSPGADRSGTQKEERGRS
jgi:hypothetical protein